MLNITKNSVTLGLLFLSVAGCNWQNRSVGEILRNPFASFGDYQEPIKMPNAVVVCRSKQCAPAKLSTSKEYIHNSLLQLFQNNIHKTALICAATPDSHTCVEDYITMPVKVGITPAYSYIDSVKISDVNLSKGNRQLNLLLNYNLTFNGQSPDCKTAQTIMFVKNTNNIIMEDDGYGCQMTAIGRTYIKTLFAIDYIDLDYGYIGGFYSIGMSGPAYGGGTGYMLLRLAKDAYPLSAPLSANPNKALSSAQPYIDEIMPQKIDEINKTIDTDKVKVFPVKNKP